MQTLGDLLNTISTNPTPIYTFCGAVLVITAVLHFVVGKQDAQHKPWNVIYSLLVYAVSIPGIFAICLSVYQFLFERKSILDMNLVIQVLPVLLMVVCLYLIKLSVNLRLLPGFGKLSSLLLTIALVFMFMFVIDRTRLIIGIFSYMPIYQVVLLFTGLFLLFRFGLRRLLG